MADSTDDILAGLTELAEAEPDYRDAKRYFENETPEFITSPKLRARIGAMGKKFRINIAKKPVTAVVDRLEIAAVTVPDNEAATKRLVEEVWDENELWLEAPIIMRRACQFGDEYVFLSDEDGKPIIERSGALNTRIVYDPERPRRPKYGIKAWPIGSGDKQRMRVNLYYPPTDPGGGRCEKWITRIGAKGTDARDWEKFLAQGLDTETDEPVEAWPLPLDYWPLYHFRTDRPYGVPLHKEAYGAQDALNKLLVTLVATIDEHGFPIRYRLTEGSVEEGEDDLDDFGVIDDAATEPPDKGKPTSKLRSGPGEFWSLEHTKGAGQFPAADPDVFLKPADWYLRAAAFATDTPLHMFDPGGDQPSGDSRRQAEGTLTKKVDQIEAHFEATWSNLLSDALKILGVDGKVDVQWTPSQTVDDLEGWQTAQAKIEAGVPVRQVLLEAGYDATQVDAWLKGTDEQDLARRVQMLGEMAKAVRDLGTGVGMGVVPAELVQSVLAGLDPNEETEEGTAA